MANSSSQDRAKANECIVDDADSSGDSSDDSSNELPSFTRSPLITLLVGENRTQYMVHQEILIKASAFFKSCLTSGMTESQKHEIVLPEDTCEGFQRLVTWMYFGISRPIRSESNIKSAIYAWKLGDKYTMEDLQNAIVDGLKHYYDGAYVNPDCLALAAEVCGDESKITALIRDQLVYDMIDRTIIYCYPQESEDEISYFQQLADLLMHTPLGTRVLLCTITAMRDDKKEPYPNPSSERGCVYHVHAPGPKTPNCGRAEKDDVKD